ncbi:MAG: radical SAM protein [Candidatus Methanomethylicaceae archaeon]
MNSYTCKVILTSDRTLMSNYSNSLFYGFISTAPKGLLLTEILFRVIYNKPRLYEDGRAILAPQGLRRIEASLIKSGIVERNEVVVTTLENIKKFLSQYTKVIGITTFDPLGKGPASTTLCGPYGIVHKESINSYYFKELINSEVIQNARKNGVKVVVGGPGAWQLGYKEMEEFGIDVVIEGEGELIFPKIVKSIFENSLSTPIRISARPNEIPSVEEIPLLLGGTIGGLVEISRGCGRGCSFCSPNMRKLRHRPLSDIIKDVETNIMCNQNHICLHAEDVLRYGTHSFIPNHNKVIELFRTIKSIQGVKSIGISHAELASISSSPSTIKEISEILGLDKHNWLGFQTGIETGSINLIERFMRFKPAPFKPNEWRSVVENAFSICSDNNFVPAATLIINLPGETENDIIQTIELIENLRQYRSFIVPLLYVPLFDNLCKPMRFLEDAKPYHLELYKTLWRHNVYWLSELAQDYSKNNNPLVKLVMMSVIKFITTYLNRKVEEGFNKMLQYAYLNNI